LDAVISCDDIPAPPFKTDPEDAAETNADADVVALAVCMLLVVGLADMSV